MKSKKNALLLVILVFIVIPTYHVLAQTSKSDPKDNQGWYGVKLKLDLPNGWETNLDFQTRFINDLQLYNGSYSSIGVTKKINNTIELQSDYRLALVQKGTFHRISVGGEATKEIDHFKMGLRLLIQNQLQDFEDELKSNQKEVYWRARFETDYAPTDRIDLYISTEPIMKFGENRSIDNWRNTAGIKIQVANRTKLNLFYIYRLDYAKATYDRLFQVFGANIEYTLKIKKGRS
ncbi:hypothetical protein GENT5_06340 [Flavobacterium ammoniigenes]|jgi:hypothetical protein|uniref:DUF2490 domain-containing protein n=1 Tax=Flavobacterium ammoniigenes TaxID=1751095 RepID=A0ABN6KY75_9FLAO|nr:DUF2490 domain-containing protein [Flavobacterium ammoniigenes]BDB54329.1 hypothetical protein GENT5_06340 [Flavobacterium ammoniigenes]